MTHNKSFDPFPLFRDPHTQTIFGSLFSSPFVPSSYTAYIKLPDQDLLTCEISEPDGWDGKAPTLVMLHGLCGGASSSYVTRLTRRFYKRGFRCVRMNLRGCGSSKKHTKSFYNCGSSGDLEYVVRQIKKEAPLSPLILMGFSLGGNISLKLAGELGESAKSLIHSMIAVNPPIDLYSSVKLFGEPQNKFYERYFYKYLRSEVHYRHKKYSDLSDVCLPFSMTLYEFDEYYMAPVFGFSSAMEYYKASSSKHYIPHIAVPCKILLAEDDPIIKASDIEEVELPDTVESFRSSGGGHLGFLGSPRTGKVRYMDCLLEEWVNTYLDFPEAM